MLVVALGTLGVGATYALYAYATGSGAENAPNHDESDADMVPVRVKAPDRWQYVKAADIPAPPPNDGASATQPSSTNETHDVHPVPAAPESTELVQASACHQSQVQQVPLTASILVDLRNHLRPTPHHPPADFDTPLLREIRSINLRKHLRPTPLHLPPIRDTELIRQFKEAIEKATPDLPSPLSEDEVDAQKLKDALHWGNTINLTLD